MPRRKPRAFISDQWDAERVRALRLRYGLTQRQLAQLLACSHYTVNRWEVERRFVSRLTGRSLAMLELHLSQMAHSHADDDAQVG